MDAEFEHSAYIDSAGYAHALATLREYGATKVAPLSAVAKERGASAIIHNHPHGGPDGRIWGGPLSSGDLLHIARVHSETGGKVNRIIATAKEGTYSARVTRPVSTLQAKRAAARADGTLKGRRFDSSKAMWQAVHDAYAAEFARIGVELSFDRKPKRSRRLVTQKIGVY
ncbi:hypothetical protein HLV35_03040 [Eggerthellaceae bacterium zg-997]|nr:hypothetical protein [Eggerthellaceae bacterium zg-997]